MLFLLEDEKMDNFAGTARWTWFDECGPTSNPWWALNHSILLPKALHFITMKIPTDIKLVLVPSKDCWLRIVILGGLLIPGSWSPLHITCYPSFSFFHLQRDGSMLNKNVQLRRKRRKAKFVLGVVHWINPFFCHCFFWIATFFNTNFLVR